MKRILLYPFKMALRERKTNKKIKEKLSQMDSKVNMVPGFIYMNYMFLIIYAIMYVVILYLIVAVFFMPLALLPLITSTIFTVIGTLLHKHVYPKTRENYLESIGYYEENH